MIIKKTGAMGAKQLLGRGIVVTFLTQPETIDAMIKIVVNPMSSAKDSCKNQVKYVVYERHEH